MRRGERRWILHRQFFSPSGALADGAAAPLIARRDEGGSLLLDSFIICVCIFERMNLSCVTYSSLSQHNCVKNIPAKIGDHCFYTIVLCTFGRKVNLFSMEGRPCKRDK